MYRINGSSDLGKVITFGRHKGSTIEQIHFRDYPWLAWTRRCGNLPWITDYMKRLPVIYPRKIVLKCGCNHPWGCKVRTATRFTAPIDPRGEIIARKDAAYYWCDECNVEAAGGSTLTISERSLDFPMATSFTLRGNQAGFHEILRYAYGLKRVTRQAAYELFWK